MNRAWPGLAWYGMVWYGMVWQKTVEDCWRPKRPGPCTELKVGDAELKVGDAELIVRALNSRWVTLNV